MTAAVLIFHLWANLRVSEPSVVFDEIGYLGNARWLAGAGGDWEMPWSPQYAIGYPLVIAPLTRLLPDPESQWRAILCLNAVLQASVLPLLHLVARKVLRARPTIALLGAAVGAVAPAVVAAGVSAIAENLVLPLVPLLVLATWSMCRPGRVWTRLLFGPAIVALYLTHARFTIALPVAALVLVWVLRRGLAPRVVVAVNAGAIVVGAAAGTVLTRAVVAARWDHVEVLEGSAGDAARMAVDPESLAQLALIAVGQAWYLAVGSVGLVVIGMAVALRRLRTDGGTEADEAAVDVAARATALATLIALAVGVFAVSVVFFARNQFRADHLVYGRHNDSFTALWLTFAIVGLAGATRARVLQATGAAAATVGGLCLVLLATRDADAFGGSYSAFAVPALVRSVDAGAAGVYWRSSLAAGIGLGVVAVIAGLARRAHLLVLPLIVASSWSGLATVEATERFSAWAYDGWATAEEVEALGIERIGIDGRIAESLPALAYPFHLPDIDFSTYEPSFGEEPTETFVLASAADDSLAAAGARIVLLDQGRRYDSRDLEEGLALWVQPGPELDRLEADGHLLPAGFPETLPPEARQTSIEVVDRPDVVEVASGGRVALEVRGRHDGSGSPWPDYASYSLSARVRIAARVEALEPGLPVAATSGGELPHWILPGDTFTADIEVVAVDLGLEPLPPGRYRVTIGVQQIGYDWFAPGGDESFDLVVT